MNRLRTLLPALAVPALAAANAFGAVIQTNSTQGAAYTVSSTDLLEGLTPVHSAGSTDGSASGGFACLTDGVAPSSAGFISATDGNSSVTAVGLHTAGDGGYDGGYTDLIYNFSPPVNLGALNLYFYWNDNGRDQPPPMTISTDSVATSSTSDPGWSTIITTTNYNPANIYSEVSITNDSGGPIATGILSLQIAFGQAQNGWVGLGEIDAVQGTPEPASLGIVGIVGCAGLLRRRIKR